MVSALAPAIIGIRKIPALAAAGWCCCCFGGAATSIGSPGTSGGVNRAGRFTSFVPTCHPRPPGAGIRP